MGVFKNTRFWFILILAFNSCLLSYSQNTNTEPASPDYSTVKEVIEGAKEALIAKEIDKLFDEYFLPSEIKKLKEDKSNYEKIKAEFLGSEKAELLLNLLKKAKDFPPVYNKAKKSLVFKCGLSRDLTLINDNDKWYIKN